MTIYAVLQVALCAYGIVTEQVTCGVKDPLWVASAARGVEKKQGVLRFHPFNLQHDSSHFPKAAFQHVLLELH